MSDQVRAIISLEVENVKIYEAKSDKLSVLTKGNLEILYLPEFNRFVLRLNSFKYILSGHLPIMASVSQEGSFRSYVLPNIGGHYILKLKSSPTAVVIRNMETIFSNYSQFSYQQNHEHDLENQVHRRGDYSLTFGEESSPKDDKVSNQSETVVKASKYIKLGGDILKQNFMKAANYIGKNLSQSKDTPTSAQGPNQLSVRSIEELKSLNYDQQSTDLPRYEVVALMTLVKEVEKVALSHAEQDIGVKLHPANDSKWPAALKKSAIDSAASVWKGMDDALTTLTKTVKAKRLNAKLPEDKMDLAFKKMEQKNKDEAPLPMHQVSPNQQQSEFVQQSKKDSYSKSQDYLNNSQGSETSESGGFMKNLGAIKQKIVGFRGEGKGRSKENYAA